MAKQLVCLLDSRDALTPHSLFYLAYGSNLLPERLAERVADIRSVGSVPLGGYRLTFRKIGVDGSGKCDLAHDPQSTAWGVIYQMPVEGRALLDRAEGPDYRVDHLNLRIARQTLSCFCYFAVEDRIDEALAPFDWYHALVLAGARRHDFPQHYLKQIESTVTSRDSDRERDRRHRRLLQD